MKIIPILFVLNLFAFCNIDKKSPLHNEAHLPEAKGNAKYNQPLIDQYDTARYKIDKGNLSGRRIKLQVGYAAIACTCAQWFELKNEDDTVNGSQTIYLERGNETIVNADTLFDGNNLPIQISVTGKFYEKKGYPKNYNPAKGDPPPASVFRYDGLKIIARGTRMSY